MFIEGFGISGYRSFAGEVQRVGPLEKINLFIGQNNSGKSNLLTFLTKHYNTALQSARGVNSKWTFDPVLDRPLGDKSGKFAVEFCLKVEGPIYGAIIERYGSKLQRDSRLRDCIDRVLKSNALSQGTGKAWFRYEGAWKAALSLAPDSVKAIHAEKVLQDNEWKSLWNALTDHISGGNAEQHWIPEVLRLLSPGQIAAPEINLVPAIRKVGDAGSSVSDDYSGVGLIERLAQLQNPTHDQQSLKKRFGKITNFLRSVTGNSSAQLEIPHDRKTILVHMEGKTLPLPNLGTGIHEVVILAAAATVLQNQAVCIEEPELHLHPLLQKKLIGYLRDKTNNQYFITTHSAHLLDTFGAAIFHVRSQNGYSTVDPVYTAKEKSIVCADLGYRAADLLQANSIIWVEGPSDRIYLNHWIRGVDPDLVEGLHYSVMFYGGRLLSHLSADDPEVGEFISLRRLNRYIAVVIDSDRSGPRSRINETKKRIIEEFNKGPGFAWLTKGREIENYVSPQILRESVGAVYPNAVRYLGTEQFSNCLSYQKGRKRVDLDKIKIAREVANRPPELNVMDLKKMITKLVDFIHESNDLGKA